MYFHRNGTMQYMVYGDCLLLLSTVFSRFILLAPSVSTQSFQLLDNILLYGHTVDRHLGYFNLLVIMNKAAVNIHVNACFHFSWVYIQKLNCWVMVKLHVVTLYFPSCRSSKLFSKVVAPFYNPTNNV